MTGTIENELNCLQALVDNATIYWARLKEMPSAILSEQDILGLAPERARRLSRYGKSLIEDIAKGKIYLIDAPQDSVLGPYRDDLESQYTQAGSFGNLSIKVGILGTFFGFILALQHLSELFVDLARERPDIMAATLQNLAYAFVKSLYGLGFSIFIAISVSRLRGPLDRFYTKFDEALRFGREFISRMTLADPAIHTSLIQVRNSLKQMEQRLFDHSGVVAEALRQHGTLINEQTEALTLAGSLISEQTKAFTLAAKGMIDVQREWDGAFNTLKDAGKTFELHTAESVSRIDKAFAGAAANIQASLQSLVATRSELSYLQRKVLELVSQSERGWAERFEAMLAESSKQDAKFSQWAEIANNGFNAVREQMRVIEANLTEAHNAFRASSETNNELAGVLGRLAQALQEYRLLGVKRLLFWCVLFIVLLAIAGVVSVQHFGDPLQIWQHWLFMQ